MPSQQIPPDAVGRHLKFKLGKRPARKGAVTLKMTALLPPAVKWPRVPRVLGTPGIVPHWKMLANDQWGCCVIAGGDHEHMAACAIGGRPPANFDDRSCLSDYSAITGFDPRDPDSDQGTDMEMAARYRRRNGLLDADGNRHKIDAYAALQAGNVKHLAMALYLFKGGVGVGVKWPSTGMDQFDAGGPLKYDRRATIEGGHYMHCPGRNANGNFRVVTWGEEVEMTPKFYERYSDEALVYIFPEVLRGEVTAEGLKLDKLREYLAALPRAQLAAAEGYQNPVG